MQLTIGVDIGGTNTKMGLISGEGNIVGKGEIPTSFEEGPEELVKRIKRWIDQSDQGVAELNCAGVGCAGLVDGERGVLRYSPNMPGWENVSLAEIFSRILELPAVVDNDVNAAAYSEFKMGAGREVNHFICLTMGTGLGGGIISGGNLLRGYSGFAGEIGHTVIDIDGPLCKCGQRGCLEQFVKADTIVKRAREKLNKYGESKLNNENEFTVKEIAEAAREGDKLSLEVLTETGRYLGIGLSNLVHLFNPQIIAIGGGVARAGELIFEPARVTFREHVMADILEKTRIVPAELGNDASFLGGALLAMDKFNR